MDNELRHGANIDQQFAKLKEVRPNSPLMCSEFWSGWFDKWGANHETRPAADMIAGIDEMLSKGISFSLYMTHGGTNWGHWAELTLPDSLPMSHPTTTMHPSASRDRLLPNIGNSARHLPNTWTARSRPMCPRSSSPSPYRRSLSPK